MLRLLLLLLGGMYLVWQIGGTDRGQQRPAMAQALALGKPVVVLDADGLADLASEAAVTRLTPPLELREVAPRAEPQPTAPAADLAAAQTNAPTPASEAIFTLSALVTPQLPSRPLEPKTALEASLYQQAAAPSDPQAPTFRLNANSVNLRAGPSTAEAVITLVGPSDTLRVLDSPAEGWVEVEVMANGARGYLASKFLVAAGG